MTTRDALTFLKQTPPFNCLNDATLGDIVKNLSLEFHTKGKTILRDRKSVV